MTKDESEQSQSYSQEKKDQTEWDALTLEMWIISQ